MIRIGDWQVDFERNRLVRGRDSIRIEPKAMDVLRALHARAGAVISKDDLIREVWGDVAVSDEVLTTAVYQLRRALGDDRRAPRYIETVPRRGYRLVIEKRRRFPWPVAAAAVLLSAFVGIAALYTRHFAAGELHRLGVESLDRAEYGAATRLLRRAADLAPRDAAVAGSLALALAFDEQSFGEARVAALRALELDPANPDALIARGVVALWSEWNWESSLRDLRAAARSGDATARVWLAYVSLLAGEPVAVASTDDKPINAIAASTIHLLLGDPDGAELALAQALRRDPRNPALLRQAAKIEERRLAVTSRPLDSDTALATLERAFTTRDHRVLYLRVDSRWASIREHPRFQAVAAAVGP